MQNLQKLTSREHFSVFTSTVFSCRHEVCSQKDKSVYLSYCWLCHAPIDSRDASVKIKGYYLCPNCGAGYRDFGGGQKYALFPATICPKCIRCQNCGGREFNLQADDGKFLLKCSHCGQTMSAPKTLQDVTRNPKNKYKNYRCSSCDWCVEYNEDTLSKQLDSSYEPIPLIFQEGDDSF